MGLLGFLKNICCTARSELRDLRPRLDQPLLLLLRMRPVAVQFVVKVPEVLRVTPIVVVVVLLVLSHEHYLLLLLLLLSLVLLLLLSQVGRGIWKREKP